jgi:hypothetical protein
MVVPQAERIHLRPRAGARHERGSVLVQVLLLCSLTVMIGAASMQMFLSNKQFAESELQSVQMMTLQGLADSVLKDEESCRLALGGPATFGGALSGLEQEMNPTPNAVSPIQIYNFDRSARLVSNIAGDPSSRFGKLQIQAVTLTTLYAVPENVPGNPNIHFAQLTIAANKVGGLPGSRNVVRSDVRLTVQIDSTNKIISCNSLTFLGTARMPLPICRSDESLFSNGNFVRCATTLCPAGETIQSFQADGDAVCGP